MLGLLNLNKPAGMTSRRVVDRIARHIPKRKAGHAGTLDPMATGVLIVCVGRATRLISHVQKLPKCYRARFRFGLRSDTDDITGQVEILSAVPSVERSELESILPDFTGSIEQTPPAYSAVHVHGRRAYDLARQGKTVELKSRIVRVHRLELLDFAWPDVTVEIECGSGTYIRSIGRDLGDRFRCGAVMTALERTRIGPFCIEEAIDLETIDQRPLKDLLLPAITALVDWPQYVCTEEEQTRLKNGQSIRGRPDQIHVVNGGKAQAVAVVDSGGQLVAIAESRSGDRLVPKQVFV